MVASFVWGVEMPASRQDERDFGQAPIGSAAAAGQASIDSTTAADQVIDSVAAAAAYLDGLINREKDPSRGPRMNLDPVRRLLAGLGNPHERLSVIHVAGSKGKGSTCLLAEALLRAAGQRVGTFTSPHLSRWTERFRIDAAEVEGAALVAAVERLRPLVEKLRHDPSCSAPSFFDATTAAALLLFEASAVDWAILEVGLGGRLDSTNVVSPAITAITSIELEHTELLGDTLASIAGEKAGIIKPGVPCVMGRLPAEAAAVVERRAEELAAPLSRMGRDFDVEVEGGPGLGNGGRGLGVRYSEPDGFSLQATLPLLGEHHAQNAAIALAMLRRLKLVSDAALCEAAATGLGAARLDGRVEVLERDPWVVVDSAHTEASARALLAALEEIPRAKLALVLSISSGKDLEAILKLLLPRASRVCFTRAEPDRSLEPRELEAVARRIAPALESEVLADPRQAVRRARDRVSEGEVLCVTGSVYLAGIARDVLGATGSTGKAGTGGS